MVSLAAHMPNLPDTDARTLALRMFYIEVSNGMLCGDAFPQCNPPPYRCRTLTHQKHLAYIGLGIKWECSSISVGQV